MHSKGSGIRFTYNTRLFRLTTQSQSLATHLPLGFRFCFANDTSLHFPLNLYSKCMHTVTVRAYERYIDTFL